MANFRDQKRKGRRHLHDRMKVAVLHIPNSGLEPVQLYARIHTKWGTATMDSPSGQGTLAGRQSAFESILFMLDELAAKGVALMRRDVISVAAGEAYMLDNDEAPDDISVTWVVSMLSADDADGLDLPVEEDV